MDMSQYRDLFVSEARNHLSAFNELIVRLEENSADRDALDELFRHAHSLKGMAATMQFDAVTGLAHHMEDLLSKVRDDEFSFTPALADLMLEGSDMLGGLVSEIESGAVQQPHTAALLEALTSFTPVQAEDAGRNTVQDIDTRPAAPSVAATPSASWFRKADTFKSVRVKTDTLDRLVTITGELITTRYRLTDQARQHAGAALDEPLRQFSSLLRELRDEVFQARMLPFVFAAERFPRLVRDLARKQGKEISFQIVGKEIELDRGILEEITEPLVHLLRNAVDHGMETPDDRVAAGKPFGGSISITVTRNKDHVDIVIADDGRGMDSEKLKDKAVEKGVITPEQAATLSAQAALMLVCAPGFSTADQVSDISGRGVGMDAVKTAVHALGGTLAIESEAGRGSRFSLRLPITVSIIHALVVECCNMMIAFPVSTVNRTIELKPHEMFEDNDRTVCYHEGRKIPVKSLNRLLGQALPQGSGVVTPAVVVEVGDVMVALLTDRLLGQQEIFVKPLGAPLAGMKILSGGATTGDGRIVFVVDASVFV